LSGDITLATLREAMMRIVALLALALLVPTAQGSVAGELSIAT